MCQTKQPKPWPATVTRTKTSMPSWRQQLCHAAVVPRLLMPCPTTVALDGFLLLRFSPEQTWPDSCHRAGSGLERLVKAGHPLFEMALELHD